MDKDKKVRIKNQAKIDKFIEEILIRETKMKEIRDKIIQLNEKDCIDEENSNIGITLVIQLHSLSIESLMIKDQINQTRIDELLNIINKLLVNIEYLQQKLTK